MKQIWDNCNESNNLKVISIVRRPNVFHIVVLLASRVPKFRSVFLYDQPLLNWWLFWRKCNYWKLKMTLNIKRSKYPIYVLLVSSESQLSVLLIWPPVFEPQAIVRPLNIIRSKAYSIHVSACAASTSGSQISIPFVRWRVAGHFETNAINHPKLI